MALNSGKTIFFTSDDYRTESDLGSRIWIYDILFLWKPNLADYHDATIFKCDLYFLPPASLFFGYPTHSFLFDREIEEGGKTGEETVPPKNAHLQSTLGISHTVSHTDKR